MPDVDDTLERGLEGACLPLPVHPQRPDELEHRSGQLGSRVIEDIESMQEETQTVQRIKIITTLLCSEIRVRTFIRILADRMSAAMKSAVVSSKCTRTSSNLRCRTTRLDKEYLNARPRISANVSYYTGGTGNLVESGSWRREI
jgi:hypothetical protein